MPVFHIPNDQLVFPHPSQASESGLLGVGGDLSTDRLILAYQNGIFPWNTIDEPLMWWSITPRLVLKPEKLQIGKSLRKILESKVFEVSVDRDFESVILHCKNQKRKGQKGSWLYYDLIESFIQLHELGLAHSVEVWKDQELVGGLYGLALGKMFCGESMFSMVDNASKVGFVNLVQYLEKEKFELIDCQQDTDYLRSFGAELLEAEEFYTFLAYNKGHPLLHQKWTVEG